MSSTIGFLRRAGGRKIGFLLSVSLLFAAAVPVAVVSFTGCAQEKKAAVRYHCPMHPTYISDKPGDCPICGMRLVPIQSDAGQTGDSAAVAFAGTGDGDAAEATAGTSTGSRAGTPSRERRILYYRSPMDPKVTSEVPAKDAMGMDFVPVYEEPATNLGAVSDHAPVTVPEEGVRMAGIRTAAATRGTLTRTVRAVGQVQSDERRVHQVTLKSAGYIEQLFVGAAGQRVRKGDPILSIYSPDLLAAQSDFLRARAAVLDLDASKMLDVRRGAEDLFHASEERLELLDVPDTLLAQIERTRIPQRIVTFTAPVSGFVTTKPVVAGMRVEPGTELYTVTDLSKVWIEADFYEYEASLLKVGQEARLTLPYDPAVSLTGRISLIYPQVDPGSRTLRVRFEIDNSDFVLKPGMYTNAELEIQSAEGILVPDNAVLDTGDRQLVFVETAPGTFTPRSVRVGLRGDGEALLLDGVKEGESVVVQANFLLDSESRIRAAFSGSAK